MITTSASIAVLINGKKKKQRRLKPLKKLEKQLNKHAKKYYK
tara:strand:+ start:1333 stop:1458 length:126 start_codon:yes stop_codon:yes gene_type:complete